MTQYGNPQQSKWQKPDPQTLVTTARRNLYQLIDQVGGNVNPEQKAEIAGPIEEVLSRFDHSTRSAMGAEQFAQTGSS